MKPVDLQIAMNKPIDMERAQSQIHHKPEEDLVDTALLNHKQQEIDRKRCNESESKENVRNGQKSHRDQKQHPKNKGSKKNKEKLKDPTLGTHLDISL